MKKTLSLLICFALFFSMISQVAANESLQLEEVSNQNEVKPIAYTHDFDEYSNVVGVLNSDGTKTAYLFSSEEQAELVDSITGLISPVITPSDVELYGIGKVEDTSSMDSVVEEASVYSAHRDRNHGTESTMIIGKTDSYGVGRSYMKFNLSSLEANGIEYSDILSACLNFEEAFELEQSCPPVIQAYLVKGSWNETGINWNNKPDYYNDELIGCVNVSVDDPLESVLGHPRKMYITKAVMAWLQGMENNGIMLKEKDDEFDSCFYTTDSSIANKRPYVTITYSDDPTLAFGVGIENNTKYYIVNKETGQYLTATSDSTGTSITQQNFSVNHASNQQWMFTRNSSNTGFAISLGDTGLCIRSRNSPTSGENAIVQLGNAQTSSYQLWRPIRNWNGTYHLKVRVSSGVSMKASQGNNYVIQEAYICDFDYFDEWSLIPVTKGKATFFDFNITRGATLDTTLNSDVMHLQAKELAGYSADSVIRTNYFASTALSALQNSSLFIYEGHGSYSSLDFYDSLGNSTGKLCASESLVDEEDWDFSLESLSDNSLSKLQLAVLSSCDSGGDAMNLEGEYFDDNLTGRLYWLGAHNVISHFHVTQNPYAESWCSVFMTDLLLGRSLKTAKRRADHYIYDDDEYKQEAIDRLMPVLGNVNERHDLGDESFRPGFTVDNTLARQSYSYEEVPLLTYSVKEGSSATTAIYNSLTSTIEQKKFSLPVEVFSTDLENVNGHIFDVYMDTKGGIYWYYQGTNVLYSYEPYTEDIKSGDFVVNQQDALELANGFVDVVGYDITDYSIRTSNEFSKDYTIEFYLPNDISEKLVFHMRADDLGNVYIESFTAYNYNR